MKNSNVARVRASISAPLTVLLAALFFLGACQTPGSPVVQVGLGNPGAEEAGRKSPGPDDAQLAAAALGVPLPHLFMGQTLPVLSEHFGAADLTRREGEATIHRFRTGSKRGPCVLLAILYDERGGQPRIKHMAVREGGAVAADPAWCLGHLAWSHQNGLPG